jgi:hypothetical protein
MTLSMDGGLAPGMSRTSGRSRTSGESRTSVRSRAVVALAVAASSTLLSGCLGTGLAGGLTANSTCKEYMAADGNAQVALVGNLYHKAHPQEAASGPGAMNAVMNVGYECGQRPDVAVGELGDFH